MLNGALDLLVRAPAVVTDLVRDVTSLVVEHPQLLIPVAVATAGILCVYRRWLR